MHMEKQERDLFQLNQTIPKMLPETEENAAMLIVLRHTRDNILKAYVDAGGTGWFGNY